MDVNILVVLMATLVAAYGSPTFNAQSQSNQNAVPGVFIPVDTLKTLQAGNGNIRQIGNPDQNNLRAYNGNPGYQANIQDGTYNIPGDQSNLNQQPLLNQQSLLNQQQVLSNQQPMLLSQSSLRNQQTVPNVLLDQSMLYQNGQTGQLLVANPNIAAMNVGQRDMAAINPTNDNNQIMNSNSNQGTRQSLVANPNIAAINVGQRDIAAINPTNDNNQIMNSNSNQGTLFAMLPVNTQNSVSMPKPNLSGNTYLIPVQQVPTNQIYALNNGK